MSECEVVTGLAKETTTPPDHPPPTSYHSPITTRRHPHTTDIMDHEKLARMQNAARTGESAHAAPPSACELAKLLELPC